MTRPAAAWRVMQFRRALFHRRDADGDQRLRMVVQNEEQWRLLARLSSFDRAHHLQVRDALVAAGYNDPDLLLAAALHDVGKADEHGRVYLLHRVLNVVARRVAPGVAEKLARKGGNWLTHGMYLAGNHPRLGAELAAGAGASERCCRLIARHEDAGPWDDPDLEALILADDRSLT